MYFHPELTKVINQYFIAGDEKDCQMSYASDVSSRQAQSRQAVEREFGRKAESCSIRRKRFFQALGMA